MILEEDTFEKYHYYPSELPHCSGIPILAACDNCGKLRETSKHHYHPLCNSCARRGNTNNFGHKTTDGTKAKQSAAMRGKNNHNYGKQYTEKEREKISAAMKGKNVGKRHTEESKALQRAAKTGKNNPAWLGGISFEPYCIKFDEAYKKIVRDKFNNRCFWCGLSEAENGRALSVHHVNYNKQCGCDRTKCICVPLCTRCHARTNGDRDEWEKKLLAKIQLLDEKEVRRED